jgi:hypothetical protein
MTWTEGAIEIRIVKCVKSLARRMTLVNVDKRKEIYNAII